MRTHILSLGLAALSAPAWAGPTEDLASARPAIAEANSDWADGLRTGDVARIVRAYAQDAVTVTTTGEVLTSRVALEARFRRQFAGGLQVVAAEVRQDGLVALGPGLLQEWGEGRVTLRQAAGGVAISSGRYSTVWRRRTEGQWEIVRNLSF